MRGMKGGGCGEGRYVYIYTLIQTHKRACGGGGGGGGGAASEFVEVCFYKNAHNS